MNIKRPLDLSKYHMRIREKIRKKIDVCQEKVKEEGVGVAIALPYIAGIYDFQSLYFLICFYIYIVYTYCGRVGGRSRITDSRNTGVWLVPNWLVSLSGGPAGASSRQ